MASGSGSGSGSGSSSTDSRNHSTSSPRPYSISLPSPIHPNGDEDEDEDDSSPQAIAAAQPSTPRPSHRSTLPPPLPQLIPHDAPQQQPQPQPPPTTTTTSTKEAWRKRKQALLSEASSQSITTTNFHQHAHLRPPVFLPTTSWLGTSSAVARPDHESAASTSSIRPSPSSSAGPATLASSHSAVLNYDAPIIKKDIIRMMEQWLTDEGFHATKQALMEEAGHKRREQTDAAHDARKLKKALLEGDWAEVDSLVSKPQLVKNHKAFQYAVYKLHFLEHIEHREYEKAFTFLAKRLKPLEHYQPHKTEFRDLCYLLSAKSITDAPSFRAWEGIQPARENLVAQFSAMLEQDRMDRGPALPCIGSSSSGSSGSGASGGGGNGGSGGNGGDDDALYVPPRRLLTLMHQAVAYQVEFARYHPKRAPVVTSLLHDYAGFIVPNAVSATLRGHRRNVKSVRFVGEEGEMIVSGSSDTSVRLWDTASGGCQAVLEGHGSRVWEVDSTRSGSMVASASGDGTVRVWDVASRSALTTLKGDIVGDAYTCTFHSDERHLLAGGYDKLLRLFDINSGTVVKTFTGHQLGVSSAVFSPMGNLIVSGSKDTMVRFWDVVSGLCVGTLHDHLGEVTSVTLNSSGLHLLTSSKDNSNRLWDMRMLRPLQRFKGHQNTAKNFVRASFAHTSLLVGGSEDGRIYMWDEESSEVLQTLVGHGQSAAQQQQQQLQQQQQQARGGAGAGTNPAVMVQGRRSRRGTMLGSAVGGGLGISSASSTTTLGGPLSPTSGFALPPSSMQHTPTPTNTGTGTTPSDLNVVYEATWNAAQSLLASCGEDGTVRTWVFDERLELDDDDDDDRREDEDDEDEEEGGLKPGRRKERERERTLDGARRREGR
ncbi:unnamed protein product [Tilletia controversa]|uniref:WD40 repeat-containing protein SMU1 n=1 Tax=Tilletia controversa TaxID=13291 RepID=A0A8X7MZD0_9BASI|nr:hypothetical protein CF328_g1085 [Tilletia controversa]KAE8253337.1 hypothetical protein A4X06_0g1531 [Tilletia controversa]CAD6962906.1 unnamed protein product [Tilletia controversa]